MDALRARAPRLPAATEARRDHACQGCRVGLVRTPVETIAQREFTAGLRSPLGYPHGHDVVMDLVVSRKLDQFDRALAPIVQWLHPQTGTAVIADSIEVVVED